jgi:hypothetical protein
MENLPLFFEKDPESISLIMPDGSEMPLAFTKTEKGVFLIKVRVETLYPVILLVK